MQTETILFFPCGAFSLWIVITCKIRIELQTPNEIYVQVILINNISIELYIMTFQNLLYGIGLVGFLVAVKNSGLVKCLIYACILISSSLLLKFWVLQIAFLIPCFYSYKL